MKRKVLAMTLVLSTFATSAFAEQPAAQKYRDILQSGKFYVEYEFDYAKKCLAVDSDRRMDYTVFKSGGNAALALGLGLINPILAIGSLFAKNTSKVPTAYYENGKFYQFEGKKKAFMATEQQLNDINIDPNEGWSSIKSRLALPPELAVFAPNDKFFEATNGATAPKFLESGSKVVGKKEFQFDKYIYDVKGQTGKNLYGMAYYMYYEKGELKEIESYLTKLGQPDELLQTIEVKKITGELPENVLKIPEGCKVYAAGLGDMNDLIDQPVQIETY